MSSSDRSVSRCLNPTQKSSLLIILFLSVSNSSNNSQIYLFISLSSIILHQASLTLILLPKTMTDTLSCNPMYCSLFILLDVLHLSGSHVDAWMLGSRARSRRRWNLQSSSRSWRIFRCILQIWHRLGTRPWLYYYIRMRKDENMQDMGLFTFYREQEEDDFQVRLQAKQKRKSNRSKHQIKKMIKESKHETINQNTEQSQSMRSVDYQSFLRNIPHKGTHSGVAITQMEKSLIKQVKLKTEPIQPNQEIESKTSTLKCIIFENTKHAASISLKKNMQKGQSNNKSASRSAKRIEELLTICEQKLNQYNINQNISNNKIIQSNFANKIIDMKLPKDSQVQMIVKSKQGNNSYQKEEPRLSDRSYHKSFLEKIRYLDNKSDQESLTSQRNFLRNSKTTQELHEENKKYINNLMNNLELHPEVGNQTAYKILRQTLKFPVISHHPDSPSKRLANADKDSDRQHSLSLHKKQLKFRKPSQLKQQFHRVHREQTSLRKHFPKSLPLSLSKQLKVNERKSHNRIKNRLFTEIPSPK